MLARVMRDPLTRWIAPPQTTDEAGVGHRPTESTMRAATRPEIEGDPLFEPPPLAEYLRGMLARRQTSNLEVANASRLSVDHLGKYLRGKIQLGPVASARLRHGLAALRLPTSPEEEANHG